ncbi:MAG: aldehyde ferredoxin oxidoreductase family protein [Dehalococcoidia bacterium]
MENGYIGQILRVDLTEKEWEVEDLDLDLAEKFIGGRGLGAKLLLDEVDPEVDPLSPENKLIVITGPLTGSGTPCGARYMMVSKSPLTGCIAYGGAGGFFGPELKFAGYDAIVFEGRSDEPVYLLINDDEIEIKPASHLWGKTTLETDDAIKAELANKWVAQDTHVACIGPAGENLVRFAAVISDGGCAVGRCGLGAVMGSKNMKAIAVRGTKGIKVADGKEFRDAVNNAMEHMNIGPESVLGKWGTWAGSAIGNVLGILPTNNFNSGLFEDFDEGGAYDAQTLVKTILVRRRGCFACPVACKPICKSIDPDFEGHGEGPEYEAVGLFGAGCGVKNSSAMAKAAFLCNEMGLDVISTGNTIACAMDLFERGFLPEADAGCKLNFGNAQAMVDMVTKIGRRDGIGDALAEGGYRLAEKYGHPEVFIGAKKMEAPMQNVRSSQGLGLSFATSNRGACHNSANAAAQMLHEEPLLPEGKGPFVKMHQDMVAVVDSSGVCCLGQILIEDLLRLLVAATGIEYTMESLLLAGERIWNAERLFNLRAGITKDDDTLTPRMIEEPMPDGPATGDVVRIAAMIPEYYEARGWDDEGVPTDEKLSELELD